MRFCALVVLLWPACAAGEPAAPPTEYQVKAAFLYNFMKFVEWPDSAFVTPEAPIRVAILGDDPFARIVRATMGRRTIGKRSVDVAYCQDLSELSPCHVLFVAARWMDSAGQISAATQTSPTLIVADDHQMAGRGATISFFMQESRVRFTIDADLATAAGLRISSRLLKLAQPKPRVEP